MANGLLPVAETPLTATGTTPVPETPLGTPPANPTGNTNNYLPSGQTALQNLPTYGGAGGGAQAQQFYAGQYFSQLFGRNPTASELAMLSPSYASGDPNIANVQGGNAAIAAYYNSLANSPTNIQANQQQQALNAYNQNPSQYDQSTTAAFQQYMGRAPTSAELTHFGSLLASGQSDSYGIGQLLSTTQEAQNYQTNQYINNSLYPTLAQQNAQYYQTYLAPQISAAYASQGRALSPSLNNAMAQAAQQQNFALQNYIAQFGAGQYGQSAQNAQNTYQNYLNNVMGIQNANVTSALGQQQYQQQQNTNLANWQMQQTAYNNYLNQYGKRSNGLGGLIGGLAGAGLGGYFGGAQGAQAGYGIGSGIGTGIQGSIQGPRYSYANI